jgi:hypothetical protein
MDLTKKSSAMTKDDHSLTKFPMVGVYQIPLYRKGDFKMFLSPIMIVFCQGFDQLRRS